MSDSLQSHGLQPIRLLCSWDFPGKTTGVDCPFLLQGIFPTQGLKLGLLHCRQILYQLNHQRSHITSSQPRMIRLSDRISKMQSFSGASSLAWRRKWQPTPVVLPGESPWTEEPGRLQSMGSQRTIQTQLSDWVHTQNPSQISARVSLVCRPPSSYSLTSGYRWLLYL